MIAISDRSPVIERRCYTLKPGCATMFWELQREFNQGETMHPVLSHHICYFSTQGEATERIVHLYSFDSLDQWDESYQRVYRQHPAEYYRRARPLLTAQETTFLRPGGGTPITPPPPDPTLTVVEERFDLWPGAAPEYWRRCADFEDADLRAHRIGDFGSLMGKLHQIYRYSWWVDMAGYRRAPSALRFRQAVASLTATSAVTRLRPAPLPSHRALFEQGSD
ncbi:NIPSNAP family protein [Amycolatopsis jejuensis]|uniref:NIPSNAP family protein n=1 Tax=Amycolatopsis jejuensis TaxID=330084 RepID=UPI00052489E9|nr:NIPSNAP family protein [Amycolatopsis jejuensis]